MRDGHLLEFSDGTRPMDPMQFAEYIIQRAKLTEARGPNSIRYYVVPHLHPKLEMFIPGLCVITAGIFLYAYIVEKREGRVFANK